MDLTARHSLASPTHSTCQSINQLSFGVALAYSAWGNLANGAHAAVEVDGIFDAPDYEHNHGALFVKICAVMEFCPDGPR